MRPEIARRATDRAVTQAHGAADQAQRVATLAERVAAAEDEGGGDWEEMTQLEEER